jgi:hypothetical protein
MRDLLIIFMLFIVCSPIPANDNQALFKSSLINIDSDLINVESESPSLKQFKNIFFEGKSIEAIAIRIWDDLMPSNIQDRIAQFIKEYSTPVDIILQGETWNDLRRKLEGSMETGTIPTLNISWQEFRGIDKEFKESVIKEALDFFELAPVRFLTTGTVGFRSDIDNVAEGADFSSSIAKLLHDTLNVFIYKTTSGIAFDSEVYTQHLGASFKTDLKIETLEMEQEYLRVALFSSFYQLYNQTHASNILSWADIKKRFNVLLKDKFNNIFDQVEEMGRRYKSSLEKIILEQPKSSNSDFARLLLDSKAILIISERIKLLEEKIEGITREINLKSFDELTADDMTKIKAREQMLVRQAYLYGIRGTFFPESYISQEAFQFSVISDANISQVLQMATKTYRTRQKVSPQISSPCLKPLVLQENPQLIIKNTPAIHIINLSEQIAYFIHKLVNNKEPSVRLIEASKYLERYLASLTSLYELLERDRFRFNIDLDKYDLADRVKKLFKLSHLLVHIKRGRVPIYRRYIFQTLFSTFAKYIKINDYDADMRLELRNIINKIALSLTNYLEQKVVEPAISVDEKRNRLVQLFDFDDDLVLTNVLSNSLKRQLDIRIEDQKIQSKDDDFTVFLNVLLGQSTVENNLINENHEMLTDRFIKAFGLEGKTRFDEIVKLVIDSYFDIYSFYFNRPNALSPKLSDINKILIVDILDKVFASPIPG